MSKKALLLNSYFLFFNFVSFSQKPEKTETHYNTQETFAQNFYTKNGNEFRSANGAPGAKYWQNRADYTLHATIDTVKNELSCNETINYINNSPDALSSVWLELDQNTYGEDARSNFFSGFGSNQHTNGFQFDSVTISYNGKSFNAGYIVNDTRMQIRLPATIVIQN